MAPSKTAAQLLLTSKIVKLWLLGFGFNYFPYLVTINLSLLNWQKAKIQKYLYNAKKTNSLEYLIVSHSLFWPACTVCTTWTSVSSFIRNVQKALGLMPFFWPECKAASCPFLIDETIPNCTASLMESLFVNVKSECKILLLLLLLLLYYC